MDWEQQRNLQQMGWICIVHNTDILSNLLFYWTRKELFDMQIYLKVQLKQVSTVA